MFLKLTAPRLLPLTILAMVAVLGMKSIALVLTVLSAASSGAAQAAESGTPSGAAPPVPAMPAAAKPVPAPAEAAAPKPAVAPKAASAPPAAVAPPPADPPVSESERSLLLDLRKRRIELDTREAALSVRDAVLAAAQTRLSARVDELAGLQKRLESLETARRDHDEANWRGLVKLYETMRPKDAANIFNDLDPAVLLPVLDRMKESKAAAVFAAMLPDRARTATTELAQMRAHANAVPASGTDAKPPTQTAGGN
jgi:flagellar motility protein MotE (MotC chaperone)